MSKEIIEKLEKAKQRLITDGRYEKCQQADDNCPVCMIDQALTKLREAQEQPPTSEFTKNLRIMATQTPYLELGGFDLPKYAENLISAADRLDTSEVARKELREACEKLLLYSDCDSKCAERQEAQAFARTTLAKEKEGKEIMTGFKVGDKGQRYEVRYTDTKGVQRVVGWSETIEGANDYVKGIELHPAFRSPVIIDRKVQGKPPLGAAIAKAKKEG